MPGFSSCDLCSKINNMMDPTKGFNDGFSDFMFFFGLIGIFIIPGIIILLIFKLFNHFYRNKKKQNNQNPVSSAAGATLVVIICLSLLLSYIILIRVHPGSF